MPVVRDVVLQRLGWMLRGAPRSRVAIALNQVAPHVDPLQLTYEQAANILGARGVASVIGSNTAMVMQQAGREACAVTDLIEPAPYRSMRGCDCSGFSSMRGEWGDVAKDMGAEPWYGAPTVDSPNTYSDAYGTGGGLSGPDTYSNTEGDPTWGSAYEAGSGAPETGDPGDDGNLTDLTNVLFPPGGWFPGGDPSLGGGGGPTPTPIPTPTPTPGPSGGGGAGGAKPGNFLTQHKGLVLAGLGVAAVGLVYYYG